MKLTKTENVKCFRFEYEDGDFEIVAAKTKSDAIAFFTEFRGIMYHDVLCKIKLKRLSSKNLEAIVEEETKVNAKQALVKRYQTTQLPFLFWTNVGN